MVVLVDGYGNHCNRLFQASHIEAFCRRRRIPFVNTCFSDMAKYYSPDFPLARRLNAVIKKLESRGYLRVHDLDNWDSQAEYERLLSGRGFVFVRGWCFRRHDLTAKYQGYFRRKFGLAPRYHRDNPFVDKVTALSAAGCALVGVHIRRGDYRTWCDGAYFFDDPTYARYIDQMRTLLSRDFPGKPIAFILFSNEPTSIPTTDSILLSQCEWYVDQYVMAKCDYLIGPPSSFTIWASYMGKPKYYHVKKADEELSLEGFCSCQ